MNLKLLVEDPIVLKVMTKFYDRSQRGIEKYGTMLTRTDLDFIDWVTHLQEEMLDAEYKTKQKAALIELSNMEKGCACYGSNEIHECQCKKG